MITNYFPKLIARQLRLCEADFSQLLQLAGLSLDSLYKQTEISHESFLRFLTQATLFSRDPAIGLKFGPYSKPYLMGEMTMMGLKAPNLLEGLRGFVTFSRIQASYISFELQANKDALFLYCGFNAELETTLYTQTEVLFLTIQNLIEDYMGEPFAMGRFGFNYARPSYGDRYEQVFHSPVSYNQDRNFISIPSNILTHDSIFYEEQLWRQGLALCEQRIQLLELRQQKLYSQRVLDILNSQPPPLASFAEVADTLNLSQRTLSRRLQAEQTRFRTLYNDVIQSWAVKYLWDRSSSIESISAALGFQDSANFRRAFKRHWGLSPQAYREQKLSARGDDT